MGKIDTEENLISLIKQYQNLVFSICLRFTGDYFTAEDLTQETFLAAYRQLPEIEEGARKTWICRIATNKCIDYNRSASRRAVPVSEEEFSDRGASEREEPLKKVMNREVMDELERCCVNLSPPYRDIAIMHYLQGKTAKEIAEQSGTGLKTVQSQIYRAREMLRKSFRKEMLEE